MEYLGYYLGAAGIFGILWIGLCTVLAVLIFLAPFFIYRIRCESIATNKYLKAIAESLNPQAKADKEKARRFAEEGKKLLFPGWRSQI